MKVDKVSVTPRGSETQLSSLNASRRVRHTKHGFALTAVTGEQGGVSERGLRFPIALKGRNYFGHLIGARSDLCADHR